MVSVVQNQLIICVDSPQAPLTVNQHASVELVMELFIKLGVRYVCVTNASGKYQGIIHKRRLLAYLKELEEEGNET